MRRSAFLPETIFTRSIRLKRADRTCLLIQTVTKTLKLECRMLRTHSRKVGRVHLTQFIEERYPDIACLELEKHYFV